MEEKLFHKFSVLEGRSSSLPYRSYNANQGGSGRERLTAYTTYLAIQEATGGSQRTAYVSSGVPQVPRNNRDVHYRSKAILDAGASWQSIIQDGFWHFLACSKTAILEGNVGGEGCEAAYLGGRGNATHWGLDTPRVDAAPVALTLAIRILCDGGNVAPRFSSQPYPMY